MYRRVRRDEASPRTRAAGTARRARSARTVLTGLVTAAVLVLAGCAGGSARSGGGADAGSGEVDPQAELVVALPSPSTILDPALANNIGQNSFMFPIYDSLTRLSPDMTIEPMLATSWEFTSDGSALEMQLRDDVTFHDGTPFDARAVQVNIERGKTLSGSTVAQQLEPIREVQVVDPTTVRFLLEPGAGASLPASFALNPGMMVSPAALAERADRLATDPGNAGSGPYVVTSAQPGVEIAYERAPQYWDEQAGLAATLRMQTVTDNAARTNGVRTGAIDLAQVTGSTPVAEALSAVESGTMSGTPVETVFPTGLLINTSSGDMAKPEIRRAVAMGVNREELVQGLFSGNAVAADQIYADTTWPHNASLTEPNPEGQQQARDLVAAAGGGSITISAPTGSTQETIANALAAQLQQIGLEATVRSVPWGQFDAQFQAGEQQAQVNAVISHLDPGVTVDSYVTGGYRLGRDRIDELTAIATTADDPTLTEEQRATEYGRIWQAMADDVMWVPLVRNTQVWVSTAGVTPADQLPWIQFGFLDTRRIATTGTG